eukprot:6619-Heterococcus_DN1.PRE.2
MLPLRLQSSVDNYPMQHSILTALLCNAVDHHNTDTDVDAPLRQRSPEAVLGLLLPLQCGHNCPFKVQELQALRHFLSTEGWIAPERRSSIRNSIGSTSDVAAAAAAAAAVSASLAVGYTAVVAAAAAAAADVALQ